MPANPYSPPRSLIAEPDAALARRPVAAWLLLLALAVVEAIALTALFRLLSAIWFNPAAASALMGLLATILLRIGVPLVAPAVLASGIWRRKPWARWVGLAAIFGLTALSLFGPDTTEYASDGEREGGALARAYVIPVLFAWWAYAFAFSAKAKRYFGVMPVSSATAQVHRPEQG